MLVHKRSAAQTASKAVPGPPGPTWFFSSSNSAWMRGSGAEPSSTNWPPRSMVR